MSHGNSFTLESVKPLYDLKAALKTCRVIFVSGEDCSDGFYVMPKEVAEDIEESCNGTHYPTSGWLLVGHGGGDRLYIFDNRDRHGQLKKDKFKEEVAKLKALCKVGIKGLSADADKMTEFERLQADINAKQIKEYKDGEDDEEFLEEEEEEEAEPAVAAVAKPPAPLPAEGESYLTNEQVTEQALNYIAGLLGSPPVKVQKERFRMSWYFECSDHKKLLQTVLAWLEEKKFDFVATAYSTKKYIDLAIVHDQDLVLAPFEYHGYMIHPEPWSGKDHHTKEGGCEVRTKEGMEIVTLRRDNGKVSGLSKHCGSLEPIRVHAMKAWIDSGFTSHDWLGGYIIAKTWDEGDLLIEAGQYNDKLQKAGWDMKSIMEYLQKNRVVFPPLEKKS